MMRDDAQYHTFLSPHYYCTCLFLHRDRKDQINNDNRKMVERMAETIRNGGPTLHGPFIEARPRKDYEGAALINMRRRNRVIGEENRRLRAAISNMKPEISAKAHAEVDGGSLALLLLPFLLLTRPSYL